MCKYWTNIIWFIQISVFGYIGNIGVFHKGPVCSLHFRLEAVLARVKSMKFIRPILPTSHVLASFGDFSIESTTGNMPVQRVMSKL